MRVAVFRAKSNDRQSSQADADGHGHELTFLEPRLESETAVLASGFPAVCAFVNDNMNAGVLASLSHGGIMLIALRCAGFNNVDLTAAAKLDLKVARVPAYSPHAVAEHTSP